MRTPFVPLTLLSGLLLAACGGAGGAPRSAGPSPSIADPPNGEGPRYQATATVLQAGPDAAAELCLGGIATSLPPQCGGPPIPNWRWEAVEGEESLNGVTWGEFHVVGTYDGETFTLLQASAPRPHESPAFTFDVPCPEPEGGWSRGTEEGRDRALALARSKPDAAGQWLGSPADAPAGGPNTILVAAFTGDPERYRAELEAVYDGPLCLTTHARTDAELLEIQAELHGLFADELDLVLLTSGTDVVRNRVEATVILADAETQAELDERYGEGVVVLTSALQPAD